MRILVPLYEKAKKQTLPQSNRIWLVWLATATSMSCEQYAQQMLAYLCVYRSWELRRVELLLYVRAYRGQLTRCLVGDCSSIAAISKPVLKVVSMLPGGNDSTLTQPYTRPPQTIRFLGKDLGEAQLL